MISLVTICIKRENTYKRLSISVKVALSVTMLKKKLVHLSNNPIYVFVHITSIFIFSFVDKIVP